MPARTCDIVFWRQTTGPLRHSLLTTWTLRNCRRVRPNANDPRNETARLPGAHTFYFLLEPNKGTSNQSTLRRGAESHHRFILNISFTQFSLCFPSTWKCHPMKGQKNRLSLRLGSIMVSKPMTFFWPLKPARCCSRPPCDDNIVWMSEMTKRGEKKAFSDQRPPPKKNSRFKGAN